MTLSQTGFIGIGFNYSAHGDAAPETMSFQDQRTFLADVRDAVTAIGGTVLFSGTGLGVWEGESEPAGSVTFSLDHSPDITERKRTLAVALAHLAFLWDQTAIALTFGETTLIGASCSV